MIKLITGIVLFAVINLHGWSQTRLLTVSSGSNISILPGTTFSVDKLTLVPTSTFTLSNVNLNRSATIVNLSPNNYIARVYKFSSTTGQYSGSIRIDYNDGAELNGIDENTLTLNIHDGYVWGPYGPPTRDPLNNFVVTDGILILPLNELTLAHQLFPLPVTWRSFTATRQFDKALLHWTTAQEFNSKSFTVQHSSNGVNWTNIGSLPGAGTSNSIKSYSMLHASPVSGINYYRILLTDVGNRISYSEERTVFFDAVPNPILTFNNPVTNGMLVITANQAQELSLYGSDGRLVWIKKINAAVQQVDVSNLAKGIYLLKTSKVTHKIIIL